jgi:shikimate dehydrogenase (EC 1.1.1.25)
LTRFAVLGQPIRHSRSPFIHTHFGTQTGIALDYRAIEVAPGELRPTLARLHAEGYAGLNLTLPLKELVIPLCEQLADAARRAGAANTLIRSDTGWTGANTDGSGLLRDLAANLGVTLAGRRVLLLGAGGAARGIVAPLLAQHPETLLVANRTGERAVRLAGAFADLGPIRAVETGRLEGEFDLLINATSAGHGGAFPELPGALARPGAVAYDLSYGPAARPFLDWAAARGYAIRADGLGMLVEQAADAFALWHGRRPDGRPVLAALRAEVDGLGPKRT